MGHGAVFVNAERPIEDDHIPFLTAGVPATDIIDLDYPAWHTAADTLDQTSARSLQIVGDVVLGLARPDRSSPREIKNSLTGGGDQESWFSKTILYSYLLFKSHVPVQSPEEHDQERDEDDDGEDGVNDERPFAFLRNIRFGHRLFDRRTASKANQRLLGDFGSTLATFHRVLSMAQSHP